MSRALEIVVIVLLAMGAAAFMVALFNLVPILTAPGLARADALTPNAPPGTPLCTPARPLVRLPLAPSARRLVGDLDQHGSH